MSGVSALIQGAMVSPGGNPNILYKALSGEGAQEQENRLLQAQRYKQEISAADMEMVSRASAHLMGLPDTAARQAAWPELIRQMQSNGFAMKADPSVYPGDAVVSARANMGLGVKDQMALRGAQEDATSLGTRWGAPAGQTAPAAPAAPGFSTDKETARRQIVAQESGGDPTALNYVARQDPTAYARGATASGKYQFVNSTWREGMQLAGLDPAQYPTAREAPEAVQDKVFDAVYAKYGTKPWEKGPRDWVRDEQGNYQLATVRPAPGAPGGPPAGTPSPYQVTAATTGAPGDGRYVVASTGNVPPPAGAPGAPAQTSATSATVPAQPPPAATTGGLPDVPPPTPPAPIVARGLTADQLAEVPALQSAVRNRKMTAAEADAKLIEYQKQNAAAQSQYQDKLLAYSNAVQSRQNQAQTQANTAEELQLKREDAQRAADKARREAMFTGAPTGWQWNDDHSALVRSPGFEGTDKDERRIYNLEHGDPNTANYAADYAAQKWTMTPNGSYIENDMSQFRPPAHAIERPTYVPQPTGASLDKVREIVADSDNTVQGIDRYLKVLRETDGGTVSAFLNNPRDPKAQKLLGAFNALKMVMRGPSAMNTGVLQPAEMTMLKEDLVSPQTVRGLGGTPEAIGARLGEIKLALLRKADVESRSVGKPPILIRTMKEFNALPSGAEFYDVDGNRQVKD